jgi:nicotinamide riboside kinase
MIKRIAITGPECTGKSQLAGELAAYYHTTWVPEYARIYLDRLDRKYNYEELLIIAKAQFTNEMSLLHSANKYLFCDTEFLVLKIWSLDKFKKCDPWISQMCEKHLYDLYLLMDIDMPWTYDPQREDPERREFLFNWYKRELEEMGVNCHIVSGLREERLKKAIEIVNGKL